MPSYTFENINTGEEYIIELRMAELDTYKAEHPEARQIIGKATPLVDPVLLGVTKPPQDFQREVLGRIKKGHRGSTIGTGRWEV